MGNPEGRSAALNKIAMIEVPLISFLNPMTISRHTDVTPHIPIVGKASRNGNRLAYLDRQEALFDTVKPQLLITYPGEFIAVNPNPMSRSLKEN